MSNAKFADILEQHNRWRRGAEIPMTEPELLGQAIDSAVAALRAGQEKAEDPAPIAKRRLKAPWPDFAGNDIFEGDVIQHPSGERGTVLFFERGLLGTEWHVDYGTSGVPSSLSLQIGDKGQAVVAKSGEASEDYFTPPEWMARIIDRVRYVSGIPDLDVLIEKDGATGTITVTAGGTKFEFDHRALTKYKSQALCELEIVCVVTKALKGKECSSA